MELNPTQLKYPLSKRKFWKKIITHGIAIALLFFIIAVVLTLICIGVGHVEGGAGFYISTILAGILLFIAALALLFFVPYGLYVHYYIQTYIYSVDDNFITIKKGPITPAEIHIQYQKIQDVYVDQDLWDRILGIYDVHIASATVASAMEAHIDGLEAGPAHALKEEILAKVTGRYSNPNPSANGTAQMPASSGGGENSPRHAFTPPTGISTATYPISNRWLIRSCFSVAASSIYLVLIFWYIGSSSFELNQNNITIVVMMIILVLIGQIIYLLWWRKNYFFEFQPDYILLKDGVISREEKHIPYDSVQDVNLNQGFFDRIFGLSNVWIQNAAAMQPVMPQKYGITPAGKNGITIPGLLLADGQKLVQIVNEITMQKNAGRGEKGL